MIQIKYMLLKTQLIKVFVSTSRQSSTKSTIVSFDRLLPTMTISSLWSTMATTRDSRRQSTSHLHTINFMIIFGYSFITLLTIIQVVSYYLCNGRFHPFAMIIMPEPENSKNDLFVRNGHTIIHQVVTSDC